MINPKIGLSNSPKYLEGKCMDGSISQWKIAGDKRFVIDCYGANWSESWIKNSNVSLKDFFKAYDVILTEMGEEEVIYQP